MEKKTLGAFLAALRKANGMTQKDLAERLNVSDKTVSRWERDDGAPDLAAIPVIAEIFGVTCDELLRGERRSPEERAEAPEEADPTPKAEKQRQRLLTVSLSKYKTRTFIAMGISAAGLIAAMICNLGFLRAYIGFFAGTVFFLASVICQAVFVNSAFLSVSDHSLTGAETGPFKWSVVRLAERSFGLTAVLLGFSLPLVIFPWDTYVGLTAGSWFLHGLIYAALALLIVAVVCYFLNASLLKKGVCALGEKEAPVYHHNHALKGKCAVGLAVVLVVTLAVHALGAELIWSTHNLAPGTTFHDYESFVAYMEQDIPYEADSNTYRDGWFITAQESAAAPEEVPQSMEVGRFDENGNPVSEDEARTRKLEDINGETVCTYIDRNESVATIRYFPSEGSVLPITVVTHQEYREAADKAGLITTAYCLLYPIELLAAAVIYIRKRAK